MQAGTSDRIKFMKKNWTWTTLSLAPLAAAPLALIVACSDQSLGADLIKARNNLKTFMDENLHLRGFKKASATKVTDLPVLKPKENYGFSLKWELRTGDTEEKSADDEKGIKWVKYTLERGKETFSEEAKILGFATNAALDGETQAPELNPEITLNLTVPGEPEIFLTTTKSDKKMTEALTDLQTGDLNEKIANYIQITPNAKQSSQNNSLFKSSQPTGVQPRFSNLKIFSRFGVEANALSVDVILEKTVENKVLTSRSVKVIIDDFKEDPERFETKAVLEQWLDAFVGLNSSISDKAEATKVTDVADVNAFKTFFTDSNPNKYGNINVQYLELGKKNPQLGSIEVKIKVFFDNKENEAIEKVVTFYGFMQETENQSGPTF